MANQADTTVGSYWQGLLSSNVYKRNQGQIARRATFVGIAIMLAAGAWSLRQNLIEQPPAVQYGVSGAVLAIGLWVGYRLINWPRFADFLIAVEAEMNKVSWPGRSELFKASVVVIFTIFGLAFLLFGYDLVWQSLLSTLGVIGS